MICLRCGHYSNPDGEMQREQNSGACSCRCHPWNRFALHSVGCVCEECSAAYERARFDPRDVRRLE
jgi:hypothetical protein